VGQRADTVWTGGPSWQLVGGVLAGGAILVEVIIAIGLGASDRLNDAADVGASFGSPAEVGRLFLTDHLLAFEITSIVLLVAAVGGVVLGGQSRLFEERGSRR
jgi:NADH-quinone oxidoreductase subunit J